MAFLSSIKIIHEFSSLKEYRLLTDFFRLIGVSVYHCPVKKEQFSNDFDFTILVNKNIPTEIVEKIKASYAKHAPAKLIELGSLGDITLNDTDDTSKEKQKEYLFDCLEKLKGHSLILDANALKKEIENLKQIAVIYVKHNLCYHTNVYPYCEQDNTIIQNAQDAFVDAYIDLVTDIPNTNWSYYASANLGRYMNHTCILLRGELLLETEKILNLLDEALKLDPVFNNAYLLKALVTEIDSGYQLESEIYYKNALEKINKKSDFNYAYYSQGRYFEKIRNDMTQAKICYSKALQKSPLNYQALYHLALIYETDKEYLKSIEALKIIANILHAKTQQKVLQIGEYQYLLKSYHEQARIYGYFLFDKQNYEQNVGKVHELLNQQEALMSEELFGKEISKKIQELFRNTIR